MVSGLSLPVYVVLLGEDSIGRGRDRKIERKYRRVKKGGPPGLPLRARLKTWETRRAPQWTVPGSAAYLVPQFQLLEPFDFLLPYSGGVISLRRIGYRGRANVGE